MEDAVDSPGLRPKRACRACIQIKAKCVPHSTSNLSICERCHRLGKQCTTPAPRKRIRRQPVEVTELQERIASLSNELEEAQKAQSTGVPTPNSRSTPSSYQPRSAGWQSSVNELNESYAKPRTYRSSSVYDICPEIGHIFSVAFYEQHYNTFRSFMVKFFPFVAFPAEISNPAIMKERPFLSTVCIMTALNEDPGLQARVARDCLEYLSRHMLIMGEKSLDLIQGILIMVAWYRAFTHVEPQLMNLLHLAKALLVDLGLNRSVDSAGSAVNITAEATQMMHGTFSVTSHNLDERRACLGFYYMNSKFSCSWRRLDPVVWTPHLEDCCRTVQNNGNLPFDSLAVALVRLRFLVEKYNGLDAGVHPGPSLPLPTYIKLFSSDLEQFRATLSADLLISSVLNLEILSAEVCLFEPALTVKCENSAHKVEALHALLTKLLAYFSLFAGQDIEEIQYIPFLSWMSSAYAFELLAKLSFLSTDGWDTNYVRENPGFLAVNEQMRTFLLKASEHEQSIRPGRTNRFKTLASQLSRFDDWYRSRLQQEQDQLDAARVSRETSNGAVELPSIFNDFTDFLWSDFMQEWPVS